MTTLVLTRGTPNVSAAYVVIAGPGVVAPPATPNYWTKASYGHVQPAGMSVVMLASPPQDDTVDFDNYRYFPMNASATQNMGYAVTSTATTVKQRQFLWAMRTNQASTSNKNANPITPAIYNGLGVQCRLEFSTVAKSQAAVQAVLRWTLGASAHNDSSFADGFGYQDIADNAGVTLVARTTLAASPDTYFTHASLVGSFKVAYDTAYLPDARLCDTAASRADGVTLDYECQDGRSESQSLAFIKLLADDCVAKSSHLDLYTNPLNGTSCPLSGLTVNNLYQLHQYANLRSLTVFGHANNWGGSFAAGIDAQLAVLTGPSADQTITYAKLMMLLDIGDPSRVLRAADGDTANTYLQRGFRGVYIYGDGAVFGGGAALGPNVALLHALNISPAP